MSEGVGRLEEAMHRLEEEIDREAELLKSRYQRAVSMMPADKNYYLNGVQIGSVVKAYLLTSEGVGIQGESTSPISDFIDSALRFANYPKKKIETLAALAGHLEKIYQMIGFQQPT
jgi:hypothetical protein